MRHFDSRYLTNPVPIRVLASSTVVTVPDATSAFRWSGRALMKELSIGVCLASSARYLVGKRK